MKKETGEIAAGVFVLLIGLILLIAIICGASALSAAYGVVKFISVACKRNLEVLITIFFVSFS